MSGTVAPGKTDWARAAKAVASADQVCLACHIFPDADALGSMLAVAHALLPGRRVVASVGDEPGDALPHVPRNLQFLPGLDLLSPPDDCPAKPQVMVTFDASSPSRLGLHEPRAAEAAELIVIDHHASNPGYGTIDLVDPGAAATAVLACELIDQLGVPLTRPIALCLYAGLATDTGSFKFASTTPAVHRLAARLLGTGIDAGAVGYQLWDRAPFGYLPVLSAALARAVLEPAGAGGRGLVWTTVTRSDRAAHGLGYDAIEPVIDVVRRTDEAEVAVVLKEDDGGIWRASARSKGAVDLARALARLGGGGHPAAAGFA
ncbi:MAG TPA: DHH family phosphoesterase, partial [Trebonia sp.]|nr:DHH family phosphoesterase [Trebonia sp.]